MTAKARSIKFNTALEELDQILERIDEGKVDLDDLPDVLKRANALITLCQEKIKKAEVEIKKVLSKTLPS